MMTDSMISYFKAEKAESLLFMLVGAAAIALAAYFFFKVKQPFYSGMVGPLVVVAIIQIVVGGSVYFRTDAQIASLNALYASNKTEFTAQETPRMEAVNKNFDTYKMIEVALILVGISLLLFVKKEYWLGFGLALFVQAGIMLTLDIFAEKRADEYTSEIVGKE